MKVSFLAIALLILALPQAAFAEGVMQSFPVNTSPGIVQHVLSNALVSAGYQTVPDSLGYWEKRLGDGCVVQVSLVFSSFAEDFGIDRYLRDVAHVASDAYGCSTNALALTSMALSTAEDAIQPYIR